MTERHLADEYLDAARRQAELRDGLRLREAADDVLAQLATGPLVLLAASEAGAGLAATCAALRDEPTAWARVTLTHTQDLPAAGKVVFVEATLPDAGWLHAVQQRYPAATVVVPRTGVLAAFLAA